jgi:hypothetical protein
MDRSGPNDGRALDQPAPLTALLNQINLRISPNIKPVNHPQQSTMKLATKGGGRLFVNCNVPLLVVVNTLLLVYVAFHTSSAASSNHAGMMMVGSPAASKEGVDAE